MIKLVAQTLLSLLSLTVLVLTVYLKSSIGATIDWTSIPDNEHLDITLPSSARFTSIKVSDEITLNAIVAGKSTDQQIPLLIFLHGFPGIVFLIFFFS